MSAISSVDAAFSESSTTRTQRASSVIRLFSSHDWPLYRRPPGF
jgi:hypothetical protein